MKESHERLLGTLVMLIFPPIMGFAVAVSIHVNGLGLRSLVMMATWLASLCYLWCLPSILQRFGRKHEILRDERDMSVFKNAALAAHATSLLYVLCACLVAWRLVGSDGSVSFKTLPIMFIGGIVVHQWALVVGSLIQDRMGQPNGA